MSAIIDSCEYEIDRLCDKLIKEREELATLRAESESKKSLFLSMCEKQKKDKREIENLRELVSEATYLIIHHRDENYGNKAQVWLEKKREVMNE